MIVVSGREQVADRSFQNRFCTIQESFQQLRAIGQRRIRFIPEAFIQLAGVMLYFKAEQPCSLRAIHLGRISVIVELVGFGI